MEPEDPDDKFVATPTPLPTRSLESSGKFATGVICSRDSGFAKTGSGPALLVTATASELDNPLLQEPPGNICQDQQNHGHSP